MKTASKPKYDIAMVGLDLTEMDDCIIRYIGILINVLPLKRIIFVHIAKKLDLPQDVLDKYPDLLAPLDENIADGIKQKVAPVLESTDTEYDIMVQEGAPLENFLRISKIKNADLVILGRKKSLKGSGLLSGHIVRKSPVSILFVTETFNPTIENILVPIDFSKHSSITIDLALRIKKYAGSTIHFSHIYNVPTGFYKTGKTHAEFAEIMKSHAANDLKLFMKDNNCPDDIACKYLLSDHIPKADLINKHAHDLGMDLIFIGSRGRTKSSALLLGSVVERLLKLDSDIPMLVVKNKGENMGFFEAFMKL